MTRIWAARSKAPTHAHTRPHTPAVAGRGWCVYRGVCRTPGLNSPVWVPDSGSARTPEPPDANQPPTVLRPVNRLAHLRLLRHGSQRTRRPATRDTNSRRARPPPDHQPRFRGLADDEHFKGEVFGRSNQRSSGIEPAAPVGNLRAPCPAARHGATPPMATAGRLWSSPAEGLREPARCRDHQATHLVFSCLPSYRLVAADRQTWPSS